MQRSVSASPSSSASPPARVTDILSSTPKASSPLNPASNGGNGGSSSPSPARSFVIPPDLGERGRTLSASTEPSRVRRTSARSAQLVAQGGSAEVTPTGSPLSLPTDLEDEDRDYLSSRRSARGRSRSPNTAGSVPAPRGAALVRVTTAGGASRSASPSGQHKLASSWWHGHGDEKEDSWDEREKKQRNLSTEHKEALENTRQRVARAVASVLGNAKDVTHEVLNTGVDFLEFAPIPGLATAAKTLLNIWDACERVDMNFLGCLRLAERCADILFSVRQEMAVAGSGVEQELADPIAKLEASFYQVHRLLLKQNRRPFLKRYLKRDEILGEMQGCDTALRDALSLFSISIQIRILRIVQENENRRCAGTQAAFRTVLSEDAEPLSPLDDPELFRSEPNVTHDGAVETITRFSTTTNALGLALDGSSEPTTPTSAPSPVSQEDSVLHPESILPQLESLHTTQNLLDTSRDLADLRSLMRNALQAGNDAQMVEVLQIGRQEMPDAIKTLQRALETLREKGDAGDLSRGMGVGVGGVDSLPPRGVVRGTIRKSTVLEDEDSGDETADEREFSKPKRSKTLISIESVESDVSDGGAVSATSSSGESVPWRRETLDREFIESGIDALRRMSASPISLPSWTITKYEIDRDEKIGIGFFSDVYKGTWRGRTVAIKVLAETTPRKLFIREIEIWKTLNHTNVIPLYGASSAAGDPPWFFVSPYLANGSLNQYLAKVEREDRPAGLGVGPPGLSTPRLGHSGEVPKKWDLLKFMHEVAKGMEYLHSKSVLHGDLKASNVLVDNNSRCLIADFGLSEMKSEAFRISGTPVIHGTLRWQSPELMQGQSQQLTAQIDIWAFAITCVEILGMGRLPWPLSDDEDVRRIVLYENGRPQLPSKSRFNTPRLQGILAQCWATNPADRPSFSKVARDLKLLRKAVSSSQDTNDLDSPNAGSSLTSPGASSDLVPPGTPGSELPSPDLRPVDLPAFLQNKKGGQMKNALGTQPSIGKVPVGGSQPKGQMTMPVPVLYTPAGFKPLKREDSAVSRRKPGTIDTTGLGPSGSALSATAEEIFRITDSDGYNSPTPVDEHVAQVRHERRYRLLLTHDYGSPLTLPLWEPTPIDTGAVGYLSKPRGEFITLFNAFKPVTSDRPEIRELPSIHGYGRVEFGTKTTERRTVAQRGIDAISGWLTFGDAARQNISRRYEFPLKPGHKVAYLCTETTDYKWLKSVDPPKKWFKAHIDTILNVYGKQHQVHKEDIFLVVGALQTPAYALFVSHRHPEGNLYFNAYSNPKVGQSWGTFTTEKHLEDGPRDGGEDEEPEVPFRSASKVSKYGDQWKTVLVARLRFKPDAVEPTLK